MRGKGRSFLDCEISRIVRLLTSTDMSIPDIAKRMRCSVSAINSVNRKMNVRQYGGRRTSWTCAAQETENRLGAA
jgi:hypothetical protein